MSPRQTGECSLWQHEVAVTGYVSAHTPEEQGGAITVEDEESLWAGVMERM